MDKIEAILTRLPHFYAKDEKSQMYQVLKAFADEFDIFVERFINRADNDLGIMTSDARDLDWRWGHMLGFPRFNGEKDEAYRMRLVNLVNALRGGTAPAVQYAVALVLGIADDTTETAKKIKVYDAWEYENTPQGWDAYGNFVVVIRLNGEDFDIHCYEGIEIDIDQLIHVVKAAGTNCVILMGNTTYQDMSIYHHHQYWELTHDDIRKRLPEMDLPHIEFDGFYDSNAREILDNAGIKFFEGTDVEELVTTFFDRFGVGLYDKDGVGFIEGEDKPEVIDTEMIDRFGIALYDKDGVGFFFSPIIEPAFTGLRDRFGAVVCDVDGTNLYEGSEG